MSTQSPVTSRPAVNLLRFVVVCVCCALLAGVAVVQPAQPQSTSQAPSKQQKKDEGYRIITDVNLVVLLASVVDGQGRFVPDLKQENFRVFEDRVEQKLSVFRREDIPITLGLVVDNSGSMRDKRERVNAAALTFVKTSKRDDEVFVVNFNDEFYLDLDKDFTNDPAELSEALERIDSRGGTAMRDAVIGSLDHLKKGTRDKKVLLVITDGEDNSSRKTLEVAVQEAQKSSAVIYAIGLLSQESKRAASRAKKSLQALTTATGGVAYFPGSVQEVEAIGNQIANDIRNQYVLAYYPTNSAKDDSFRAVKVELNGAHGHGKLQVRTRTGYYAQKGSSGK
jgi:Ca-activated chloride channel family protein